MKTRYMLVAGSFIFMSLIALMLTPAAAANRCAGNAYPISLRSSSDSQIVDEINEQGFHDIHSLDLKSNRDAVVTPLVTWYARRIVDMGHSDVSDERTNDGALAISRYFVSLLHRRFAVSVWNDPSAITNADGGMAVMRGLCIPIINSKWNPFQIQASTPATVGMRAFLGENEWNSPIDPLMLSLGVDEAPYTFNEMVVFTARARVDLENSRDGVYHAVLPHYLGNFDRNPIQGLRIDASSASLSLYILWGSKKAIRTLGRNMNAAQWKSMSDSFVPRDTVISDLLLSKGSYGGLDMNSRQFFGTTLNGLWGAVPEKPLQTAMYLRFSGQTLDFGTVAIVRGMAMHPSGLAMRYSTPRTPLPSRQSFSAQRAMMYLVSDRYTHALFLVGIHIPSS